MTWEFCTVKEKNLSLSSQIVNMLKNFKNIFSQKNFLSKFHLGFVIMQVKPVKSKIFVVNFMLNVSEHILKIKSVMQNITLPTPDWAKTVPEDEWKKQLLSRLEPNSDQSKQTTESTESETHRKTIESSGHETVCKQNTESPEHAIPDKQNSDDL